MAIWNRKQPLHRPEGDIQQGEEFDPTEAEMTAFDDMIIATSEEIAAHTQRQSGQPAPRMPESYTEQHIEDAADDVEVSEARETEITPPSRKQAQRKRQS